MRQKVSNNCILDTSTTPQEWSRAVETGGDNAFMYEYWAIGTGSIATLMIEVQGSNDLANWTGLTSTVTTSASFPIYDKTDTYTSKVPWQYLRLRYMAADATTQHRVMMAATIETYMRP